MHKKVTEVNRLYNWRREQVIDLFDQVTKRANSTQISLGARNLEEADVMFQGYIIRYQNLQLRLKELDKDYYTIMESIITKTLWYKILGWLPFLKISSPAKELIDSFISKWEKYEPGW